MEINKLIGLQRAEYQKAENLDWYARFWQLLSVILSIIGLFFHACYIGGYILTILSVISAFLWLYNSEKSKYSQSTAEKARRTVLFVEGLGIKLQPKFYSDLQILFTVNEQEAKQWEDQNYFKASEECGHKKLAKMLEESSFWSKYLLQKYAKHTWYCFVAILLMSLLSLLITQITDHSGIIISQVVCVILIWLATGSMFSKALTLNRSVQEISFIEERLNNIVTSNQAWENILIYMSDYNSIIQGTPVIPTKIYKKNKNKLNQLWSERTRKD